MSLESLQKGLWVVIRATAGLATVHNTLSHDLLRALQQQDEEKLVEMITNGQQSVAYVDLITNDLIPTIQVLHRTRETINNNVLLAFSSIFLEHGSSLSQ